MKHKTILLSSVSAVAASTAAVGGAYAQMPAVTGYTYSVQGSAIFSPGPDNGAVDYEAEQKLGHGYTGVVISDHPGDVGYAAAGSFGVEFNGGWDATFGLSANEFVTNKGSVTGTSGFSVSGISGGATGTSNRTFTEKTVFGFETADAEIGFTPVLADGFDVRIFGGVRALHVHSSVDDAGTNAFTYSSFNGGSTFSVSGGSTFDKQFSSDFFGAGPRIGISASKRFDGSNFGLSGSLAAAAIFGQQTDTSSFSDSSSYAGSNNGSTFSGHSSSGGKSSHTYSKTVFDLQAQAGVDYYLNDTTKLTVGYQVEELTNVGPGANSNINKTIQGAFVKVSGSFN